MNPFLTFFGAFALVMLVAFLLFSLAVWLSNLDDRRELHRRFPRQRGVLGALQILGGTGYQRGVEVQETGINCESFECRYYPEVNDGLQGIGGETFLNVRSAKFSRDVTIQGEVGGSTGVMAFSLTTANSVSNDIATYGDGTGALLFDEATETQNRTAWRSINAKLSSKPLLTVS